MIRIVAPHFVAAVLIEDTGQPPRVVAAAPILTYMLGWTRDEVQRYARRRGWTAEYFA